MIRAFLAGVVAGVILAGLWSRWSAVDDTGEIAALERWERARVPAVRRMEDSLHAQVGDFHRRLTVWDTLIRVDTLRATDTVRVPVTVLLAADSTIRSCAVTVETCQQVAAAQRERADSALRLADLWHRQAVGKWFRPSAEVLVWPSVRVAGELAVGSGRWSLVGRVELDSVARSRVGVRMSF